MKYLKKFESFSSVNESAELPEEVKNALKSAFDRLPEADKAEFKEELADVTPAEIQNAVKKAQNEVQGPAEEGKNESFLGKAKEVISKNKGTIGVGLLVAGLAALGIKGEQATHLTNILKDNQTLDVLTDPAWLAASLSFLSGLVMTGSAVKAGHDAAKDAAKLKWENNMIKKGLAKRDEKGVLINLKTGKEAVYSL
jgi:hypothetical protein